MQHDHNKIVDFFCKFLKNVHMYNIAPLHLHPNCNHSIIYNIYEIGVSKLPTMSSTPSNGL